MIILKVSMEIEAGVGLTTFVLSFPCGAFADMRFVQGTAGRNKKLGFCCIPTLWGLSGLIELCHCGRYELASCTGNWENPFP